MILVVDDVEDNRDVYAAFFEHAGFRVEQATDGAGALARIEKEKPVAIIMDLSMPVLDGWETTRRVKSDPRTADIVIVVLTGHAMRDEIAKAKAAGADAIVVKPCLPDELHRKVEMLLDARRPSPKR